MAQEEVSFEEIYKEELSKMFYEFIKKVVISEKATRMIELENKIIFEVSKDATKPIIKELIEKEFGKKVKKVNVMNSIDGKKKAIVTFVEQDAASDLASELGVL